MGAIFLHGMHFLAPRSSNCGSFASTFFSAFAAVFAGTGLEGAPEVADLKQSPPELAHGLFICATQMKPATATIIITKIFTRLNFDVFPLFPASIILYLH
jgi:hypothetical protein